MVSFILKFSLIHETFLSLQRRRREADPKASMLQPKLFPDTRFAYALLMLRSVELNWSILQQIVETADFKLCKRHAKPKAKEHFTRFENLVGNLQIKRKCEALRALMGPMSVALHFHEGDSMFISHILPVYNCLYQHVQRPPDVVTEAFEAADLSQVAGVLSGRWLGSGSGRAQKMGLRHDVHGLSYTLDRYAQCVVDAVLGEEMSRAITASYPASIETAAILQYCGGERNARFAELIIELGNFKAHRAPYDVNDNVEVVVKLKAAMYLETMDEETKSDPTKRFIAVLQEGDDYGDATTVFEELLNSRRLTPSQIAFCEFALDIHGIVGHACAVERVNKEQNRLHNKGRASMNPTTVLRALYVLTNQQLLYKADHAQALKVEKRLKKKKRASATEEEALAKFDLDDAMDALAAVNKLDTGDYLPAVRGGDDDDDDDDEEEDVDDDEFEEDDGRLYLPTGEVPPPGYSLVPKPSAFLSDVTDLYLIIYSDQEEWWFGKLVKYKPKARLYNYDIEWRPNETHQQGVKLDAYFEPNAEDPGPGSWAYLKKNQSQVETPQRRIRDREEEEDSDGSAPSSDRRRRRRRSSSGEQEFEAQFNSQS
jgi:hypothetical protein